MTINALQSAEGRYVTYPVQVGELNVVDTRYPRGWVKRYFAGAGTAGVDCTIGVQRAIVAASSGTRPARPVVFDDGEFLITDECRATQHFTVIQINPGVTIRFNPTAAKTLFRFERTSYADTAPMYGCGVIGAGDILSDDSTFKKIAVDAVDCSSFWFDGRIFITSWNGAKNTASRSPTRSGCATS
jgi:hypothetical protein